MKRRISNRNMTKLHLIAKEESGLIFPYVFTIMLVVSSYVLFSWQHEKEQLNHIQLLDEQETIQNLIQISLHEFSSIKNSLELSEVQKTLKFKYKTGTVKINYYLSSPIILKLEVEVQLLNPERQNYILITEWNV